MSRCFAVGVGLSVLMTGVGAVNEIRAAAQQEEEVNTKLSFPELQSDLQFSSRELLFDDGIESEDAAFSAVAGSLDMNIKKDSLLAEKIATDWVEPAPVLAYQKTYTYEVRVYSEEEIANNALSPYKDPQNTDVITYYYDNMEDAIATPYCPEYANDEDLYLMAKIIHAEICTLGDEARRCVGTVILNRAWNDDHPDTIYDVIHESGQFSTAWTTKEPCADCLAAAYDVLYNGYRSFPHYVDSFQSICNNYFSNHKTYIAFNDGQYKTYFSYNSRKERYVEG